MVELVRASEGEAAGGALSVALWGTDRDCGGNGGANEAVRVLEQEEVCCALSHAALAARVWAAGEQLQAAVAASGRAHGNVAMVAIAAPDAAEVPLPQCVLQLAAATRRGLAFAAMDVARWPAARAAAVLSASGAALLLAPASLSGRAKAAAAMVSPPCPVVSAEAFAAEGSAPAAPGTAAPTAQHQLPLAGDLIWLQFTSGSTGVPKGVLCTHGAAAAYVSARAAAEGVGPRSVVLLASALTFDPHQADILSAISARAKLAIAPRAALLAQPAVTMALVGATHVCMTPATFALIEERADAPPRLRVVSLGGEPMSSAVVARWADRLELRNVYGVTECCAYQTAAVMTPGCNPRDIGRPLACCDVDLRRSSGEFMQASSASASEPLELCIRGPVLARGYLGDDALSARCFVGDGAERRYLTGDLVTVAAAGQLCYVARVDEQIKIAGARLELGEVDAALSQCTLVRVGAAVLLDRGGLVGAVVPASAALPWDTACEAAAIALCAKHLPQHAVPGRVVSMENMPLTRSGKVDRKALRAAATELVAGVGAAGAQANRRMPTMALQRAVARAWASALGVDIDVIGLDDSFLALGGNSLQALRACRALALFARAPSTSAATAALAADERGIDLGEAAVLAAGMRQEGDEEPACLFGLDMGALAPCELMQHPVLVEYAAFLKERGVVVLDAIVGESDNVNGDVETVPAIDRLLVQAAGERRPAVVAALLYCGASPNASLPGGFTALHSAAAAGCAKSIGSLLEAHAEPGAATDAGTTPAHLAAAAGAADALKGLLQAGADAGARDGDKQTILHLAVRSGDVAAVRIAAAAAKPLRTREGGLEAWDRWKRTAARVAAEQTQIEVLEALVEAGASAREAPAAIRSRAAPSAAMHGRGNRMEGFRKRDASAIVEALVAEVCTADDASAARAASSLRELVCASKANRALAANAGTAEAMVALLARGADCAVQAAGCLRNLSAGAGPGCAAVLQAGAVLPLASLVLADGDGATKDAAFRAAAALCNLAADGPDARNAVRATGCVDRLAQMLEGGGWGVVRAPGLMALLEEGT